jgi:hypothetical protein
LAGIQPGQENGLELNTTIAGAICRTGRSTR